VSISQNNVVAVRAVDAVEITIETTADVLRSSTENRAMSWRTRLWRGE
jgi:hypothetical protein